MGKQIQFHLFREDAKSLLDHIQKHDPVVITLRSSDSAEVQPIVDPLSETDVMTLWNQTLISSLSRKSIKLAEHEYYRVDDSLPTLEFCNSRLHEWNGKPALLQGRVYGSFDNSSQDYEKWFNSLASWIRRKFIKNPAKALGGYLGPSAVEWFQRGGILLPMFLPPITKEWLAAIEAQQRFRT